MGSDTAIQNRFHAVFFVSILLSACSGADNKRLDEDEKVGIYSKSISVFDEANGFAVLRHILQHWEAVESAMLEYEHVDNCVKESLSIEALGSVHQYSGDIKAGVTAGYESVGPSDRLYGIVMHEPCIVKDASIQSSWMIVEHNGSFRVLAHEIMME